MPNAIVSPGMTQAAQAGWSVPTVLAALATLIGVLALIGMAALMIRHRGRAEGERVVRKGARNTAVAVMAALFGVWAIAYTVGDLAGSRTGEHAVALAGLFFPLIGLAMVYLGIFDRLTYDETGVTQFRALRKRPKAIRWSEVTAVKLERIGPLLEVRGGGTVLYVELQNDGVPQFLGFLAQRVEGENRAVAERLLYGETDEKPDG